MEKIQEYLDIALDKAVFYTPKIVLAALAAWIGFKLIKKITDLTKSSLNKSRFDANVSPFIISLVNISLKVVVLFIIATILGADLTGFIAILAAAGFAVGMALQGSLGNFASGILILIFKPFKTGDWVQLEDHFGSVEEIGLFNTKIRTPDHCIHIIPNSKITDSVVSNYSEKGMRRLEVTVPVPYGESFPRVEHLLRNALKQIPEILNKPEPVIEILTFDTHNIIVAVRPYAQPDLYWDAVRKTHATIKKVFHENNIEIAYVEGYQLGEIGE